MFSKAYEVVHTVMVWVSRGWRKTDLAFQYRVSAILLHSPESEWDSHTLIHIFFPAASWEPAHGNRMDLMPVPGPALGYSPNQTADGLWHSAEFTYSSFRFSHYLCRDPTTKKFSGEEGFAQMAEDESGGGEWLLQVGLTCP